MALLKNAGVIVIEGTVWEDCCADLTRAATTGPNAPSWAAMVGGVGTYAFSATTMQELFLSIQMSHSILPGSTVYPHIHWAPQTTNTGVCRWGLEYSLQAVGGGAYPGTTTIYSEQAGGGVAFAHQLTEFAGLTGFAPSTVIMCRIFRDATHINDSFTGLAFGITVDLHYQKDRDGSTNRAPPWDT